MKNLSNLAVESDECRALLQECMIGPFMNKIQRRPMGIVFETKPWKDQGVFFWKFVLREALHSAGFGMFSDKSALSFLERVQARKLRSGWLQCRKDYAVYLQEDGRVYVLYPSSFPFAKKDKYEIIGQGEKVCVCVRVCLFNMFFSYLDEEKKLLTPLDTGILRPDSCSVRAGYRGRTMGCKGGDH